MSTAATSACAITMIGLLHSFRKYLHKPPVTLPSSRKNLLQPPVKLPCSPFHPSSIYFNSPTSKYPFFPMAVSPLITNRNPSSTTIPLRAKHRSSGKVNIRCRFGGKLMPRLSDGAIHYVGGRTRITDFRRDTTLQELYGKMEDISGGPVVICYKRPDQNLDSLVSISSAEDLDNMLNEYDYLLKASKCGYPRLQVFLFPLSNRENSLAEFNDAACNDSGLSCIEEVNGASKDDGFKTYENDNKEGTTSMLHVVDDRDDGNGNENTLVPEHQRFLAHSNIKDEINVAPQIVNPPNDVPYVLPTYEEPRQIHYITPSSFAMAHEPQPQNHQLYGENFLETSDSNSIFKKPDPWNVPGPSNVDSYFGHFRHTQELSTDEADEDLHYLIELVESVLQSPYIEDVNGATKDDGFKTYENDNKEGATSMLRVDDRGDENRDDNTPVLEHRSFLAHSNINDEINVTPQIINQPNGVPYISPTYEEPHQIHYITPSSFAMAHDPQPQNYQLYGENFLGIFNSNSIFQNQDPWNVPGPSNIDSYFGHFRHTRDIGTYEEDEDLQNLVELVESVLQSP